MDTYLDRSMRLFSSAFRGMCCVCLCLFGQFCNLTTSTMSRSQDAKDWKPDASEQNVIDIMTNYGLVAEHCAMHLRSFDFPTTKRLWEKVQADFLAHPDIYLPSAPAQRNDIEGRKKYQHKCQVICFPPELAPPPSCPEKYRSSLHPNLSPL